MRLLVKTLMVVGMTLAILVPLAMIRGTIAERQAYRRQAVAEIARSHAGAQAFAGPVLVVPYTEVVDVAEKDAQGAVRKVPREQSGTWRFLPARLAIEGRLRPDVRRRGVHEVRVYELQAQVDAAFDVTLPAERDPARPRRIGAPTLAYGIADVRGLAGSPRLRIDGADLPIGQGGLDGPGVHGTLPAPRPGSRWRFATRLDFALGGTESLALVPLGTRNRVRIRSSWPHPQFGGSFLPRTRTITGRGFDAEWEISSLATDAQAQVLAGRLLPVPESAAPRPAATDGVRGPDAIGLSLVDPVNVYTQVDRASKYGLLFVLLTFVGFFMFELVRRVPIHPIQYGLVGLALAIFFLLLLALSEHVAFGWAYAASSVACIGLVGFYLAAVLHSTSRGVGVAAMLGTLYAALYGLLVSEDNALVLGAGLLFVILAAIMVVTRRIDWYAVGAAGARMPAR